MGAADFWWRCRYEWEEGAEREERKERREGGKGNEVQGSYTHLFYTFWHAGQTYVFRERAFPAVSDVGSITAKR